MKLIDFLNLKPDTQQAIMDAAFPRRAPSDCSASIRAAELETASKLCDLSIELIRLIRETQNAEHENPRERKP